MLNKHLILPETKLIRAQLSFNWVTSHGPHILLGLFIGSSYGPTSNFRCRKPETFHCLHTVDVTGPTINKALQVPPLYDQQYHDNSVCVSCVVNPGKCTKVVFPRSLCYIDWSGAACLGQIKVIHNPLLVHISI